MSRLSIQSKTTAAMQRDLGWMRFPDVVVVVVVVDVVVAVEELEPAGLMVCA